MATTDLGGPRMGAGRHGSTANGQQKELAGLDIMKHHEIVDIRMGMIQMMEHKQRRIATPSMCMLVPLDLRVTPKFKIIGA